jgi:hypothetical protein
MWRWRLPALAVLLTVVGGGCLAPAVRYARPSGAVVGPGVYRVPRGWDYRADYRIPASRLQLIVQTYIGVPNHYGGTTRKGLDCSGLVFQVFKELNKARMPRTTRRLRALGFVVQRQDVRAGDLVFFSLGHRGTVDHVGICLGPRRFVHASSSKGVTYASLDDDYFRTRVAVVRRVF